MIQIRLFALALPISFLLTTASCSPSAQEGGGIGGTGIVASVSSGPITNFGSVFVSGVEYDTASTLFTVDRKSGAIQTDLKKGMVVRVEATLIKDNVTGEILNRLADRITYSDSLEGPVQAVEPTGRSLTVLGQTVLVTDGTLIDDSVPGRNLARLVPDVDVLEVSGFVSGDGVLVATLIDRKLGPPDYEIKGLVKNHDATAKTFQIGRLTIDYQGADVGLMPNPATAGWNGLPVHVLGLQFSTSTLGQPDGRLQAASVAPDFLEVEENTRAEIEGFVNGLLPPSGFLVGSVQVRYDDATLFEGGTAADLGPGVRVEVDGTFVGNVLQARRVELSDRVKLEVDVATVTTTDGLSGILTLTGMPGTMVHVTAETRFKGTGGPGRLGDLAPGDHVVVRGEPSGAVALATEITRQVPSSKVVLQGPAGIGTPPVIVVLGTAVDTSGLPESSFRQVDDSPIGRAAFFDAIEPGMIVELEGTRTGASILWQEAELQE